MTASSYLSSEIALIQRDLDAAIKDNERMRALIAAMQREREITRSDLRIARTERDEYMMLSANLQVILDSTASHIVQGINQVRDNDKRRKDAHAAKDADRYAAEHPLNDGLPEHRPTFLDRKRPEPAAARDRVIYVPIPGASEQAPPVPQVPVPPQPARGGRVPPMDEPAQQAPLTHVPQPGGARVGSPSDPRLPVVSFGPDDDFEDLRRLGGQLGA